VEAAYDTSRLIKPQNLRQAAMTWRLFAQRRQTLRRRKRAAGEMARRRKHKGSNSERTRCIAQRADLYLPLARTPPTLLTTLAALGLATAYCTCWAAYAALPHNAGGIHNNVACYRIFHAILQKNISPPYLPASRQQRRGRARQRRMVCARMTLVQRI